MRGRKNGDSKRDPLSGRAENMGYSAPQNKMIMLRGGGKRISLPTKIQSCKEGGCKNLGFFPPFPLLFLCFRGKDEKNRSGKYSEGVFFFSSTVAACGSASVFSPRYEMD